MLVARPSPKASPIERLAFATFKSAVTRTPVEDLVTRMRDKDEILALHTRSVIAPGNTGTSGFASELVDEAFGGFLAGLAPGSAAARIMALGLQVPFQTGKEEWRAPKRNTAPATLPWVEESEPIAVREYDFDKLTLTPKKMGTISVISRELAKRGNGESVVRALLREDGALALDTAYFSDTAVSSAAHAGLLSGLTPITGYAGGDLTAFQWDMSAILEVIGPKSSGQIVYVTGQFAAERIALKFPDFRSPVYPSQAVADDTVIGIDAGALVHSFGDFDILVSTDAVVHMSDTPLEIVSDGPTTADPVRSLFQTDAIGLRILGDVAFGARKSNAVAVVEGVTW